MRRVIETVFAEENIGGGPADESLNTKKNSAAICAFTLAAAKLSLLPREAPANPLRTDRFSTATEPSAKLHGFAVARTLKCDPAWPVMP